MSVTSIFNAFLSCTITVITLYISSIIIFKEKGRYNLLKDIIILLVSSIFITIIFTKTTGTIKSILMCLTFTLTLKYIFNKEFSKSVLTSIIYIILLIIPDLIVLIFATKLLSISKEIYYTVFAGSILGNITVNILMILTIHILRKPIRKILNINISATKKITFVSILTIIFIAVFFYKFAIGYRADENILVYLVSMIAFSIVLFTLFKEKIENENMVKKYDDLLNIMKTYEKDIEHQSEITHEIRNELMTIRNKVCEKNKELEIIEYIDSILGDNVSSDVSKYAKFVHLPSNGLRGFFYYKSIEAEKKNVNVSVNISKTLEKSVLSKLDTKDFKDLGRILGVYLDNAIDASSKAKNKQLGIEIYLIKKNVHIIITNTFVNNVDIDKLGKEKYTTKGKNHGYGLLLVSSILKNNDRFISSNKIVNNLYIQELIIKEK